MKRNRFSKVAGFLLPVFALFMTGCSAQGDYNPPFSADIKNTASSVISSTVSIFTSETVMTTASQQTIASTQTDISSISATDFSIPEDTNASNEITSTSSAAISTASSSALISSTTKRQTSRSTKTTASKTAAVSTTAKIKIVDAELFTAELNGIDISVTKDSILEKGTVNGQNYSLTINLSKWERFTTPEQMVVLSRLFWQCYPKMYARFSDLSSPPTDVTLAIENEGYEVAWASGRLVHLHDQWLYRFPEDYDCITHELAHVIQNGWDDTYLENSGYIERFADCCRYEYALDNGYYNDGEWTLQTIADDSSRGESVRFFVWLDYM